MHAHSIGTRLNAVTDAAAAPTRVHSRVRELPKPIALVPFTGAPGQKITVSHETIETFLDVDLRVGRVIKAEEFPRARKPADKLWIDFGELRLRKSSARITDLYTVDELKDRLVLAVVNLRPRQVADFISEVLVLGVPTAGDRAVALVGLDREILFGLRLLQPGLTREHAELLRPNDIRAMSFGHHVAAQSPHFADHDIVLVAVTTTMVSMPR